MANRRREVPFCQREGGGWAPGIRSSKSAHSSAAVRTGADAMRSVVTQDVPPGLCPAPPFSAGVPHNARGQGLFRGRDAARTRTPTHAVGGTQARVCVQELSRRRRESHTQTHPHPQGIAGVGTEAPGIRGRGYESGQAP